MEIRPFEVTKLQTALLESLEERQPAISIYRLADTGIGLHSTRACAGRVTAESDKRQLSDKIRKLSVAEIQQNSTEIRLVQSL